MRWSGVIITIVYLLHIHSRRSSEDDKDDSSVEIVLTNSGADKIQKESTPSENVTSESKSRVLKNLLTVLVNHLMSSGKFKGNFLREPEHPQPPQENQNVNNNPTNTSDLSVLNKIDRIPMSYALFCSFIQNLDFIRDKLKNRSGIGRIRNIMVYEGFSLTDYWGRLKFRKEGDKLVDETGYFEGIKVDKFEDLLDQGRMTETGFVQKKEIGSNEVNGNLITMKLLLNEIAKEKNVAIHNVMEEKCNMSVVEEVIFHGINPSIHNEETVHVCICRDSFCKEPCGEVISMKKKELNFKD